ncbi:MAG: sigma-70 family RNA polymerase sigma factor [Verrucomicrobiaceae bacterium]|nr:sigma-70 family RNA polymerase sigma factor [Verrucomicrobiaceae bacterium]
MCLAKCDSDDGRAAMAELCDAYYEPVLAWLRCELRQADAARDMAHAFFANLLRGGGFDSADRERGRFRAYLLGSLKHFLLNQRATARARKRGGDQEHVSLEDETLLVADSRQLTPDAEFDRQWALTVLGHALQALKAECEEDGRGSFFEKAKPWLTGEGEYGDQSLLAAESGMTVPAFKMAIQRLKQRFRQCVKAEISSTLENQAMVEAEMKSLFHALT